MRLVLGDCMEAMRDLPDCSIDSGVTDPPYGLEFMGKEWDKHATPADFQEWCRQWGVEVLRVLKPGGHLLAFGGTRTYHRLVCGLEDAGFEVRDTLAWMYGSGFPKSLDVSKAIDKAAGAERRIVGTGAAVKRMIPGADQKQTGSWIKDNGREFVPTVTAPATDAALQWKGFGTALKPAYEPIVLARKPLVGTVAANVMAHGTGALNIDGCRIEGIKDVPASPRRAAQGSAYGDLGNDPGTGGGFDPTVGRWPANVLLDEEAAAILDAESGESVSKSGKPRSGTSGEGWGLTATGAEYDDRGGPSRFFYCAKTSSNERHRGLDDMSLFASDGPSKNTHPTVKPVALMQWLCRLVTPPGGTILDPFLGSGTTGIAATLGGFDFIGIEREDEYMQIARSRIDHWTVGYEK